MAVKLFCFDVNGTLFEDGAQFWEAINGIFDYFGKPRMPLAALREEFGQPWAKIYRERGIAESMASDAKLYEIYNELYLRQPLAEASPGVLPALRWLKKKGVVPAIVSTQQDAVTTLLLEKNNLDDFFGAVESGSRNKAESILRVCAKFGISPAECAYLGDQEGDVLGAKAAGCLSIAFAGGIHSEEKLAAAGPDFLIGSFAEIVKLPIF